MPFRGSRDYRGDAEALEAAGRGRGLVHETDFAIGARPVGQLPVVMRRLIAREAIDQAIRGDDVEAIGRRTAELAADQALGPARRIATSIHLDGPLAAAPLAEETYARLDHRVPRRMRLEVCLAAALAFESADRRDEALDAAGRAAEEAEPESMVQVFQASGPVIARLVSEVASLGRTVTRASPRFLEQMMELLGRDVADEPSSEPATGIDGDLSDRELGVLQMLRSSLSLPQIAGEMHVSDNTVKTHVQHIYRKLGTRNRIETVERARAKGLLA